MQSQLFFGFKIRMLDTYPQATLFLAWTDSFLSATVILAKGKMKFCKKYQEYMHKQEKQLPGLGFKNLKKILKRCKRDFQTHKERDGNLIPLSKCPDKCTVCDGTFFPPLLKEMSAVVGCFNERAKKLLELRLASGFRKYLLWFKTKQRRNHETLIEDGRDLVDYAMVNAIAIRKILKKYDKIHHSKQGQAIKSQAQSMHIEILQSPWLYELLAFHINLSESKVETRNVCGLFDDCSLKFDGGKLSLSCALFDPFKLDIDLTCSICLDTLFDPICVTCGHIFCYTCACSAASVTIVDGLNNAEPKLKCSLCRQEAVYGGAMHLVELNIFLSQSFPEYWSERIKMERAERMRQVKEHWDSQCRAFTGI